MSMFLPLDDTEGPVDRQQPSSVKFPNDDLRRFRICDEDMDPRQRLDGKTISFPTYFSQNECNDFVCKWTPDPCHIKADRISKVGQTASQKRWIEFDSQTLGPKIILALHFFYKGIQ